MYTLRQHVQRGIACIRLREINQLQQGLAVVLLLENSFQPRRIALTARFQQRMAVKVFCQTLILFHLGWQCLRKVKLLKTAYFKWLTFHAFGSYFTNAYYILHMQMSEQKVPVLTE